MRMHVITELDKFSFTVENVNHVPRVGDCVEVGFQPAPSVKKVIWNYSKNEVLLDCRSNLF